MWSFFVLLMTFFCTITAVPFLQSSPDIYSEAGTDSPRWLTSADFGDGMLVQNIVPHANSETDLQPAGNRLLSSELNPGWGSTSPGFPSLRSSLVDSPPPGSSYSTAQTEYVLIPGRVHPTDCDLERTRRVLVRERHCKSASTGSVSGS